MDNAWKPDIVIYHDKCADGFAAAWACWKRWGDACQYVAANYGDTPPDVTNLAVLIVDFSYKRPVLEEMASRAAGIIVLDHHESAQDDLAPYAIKSGPALSVENAGVALKALISWHGPTMLADFDMQRSGAGLAWSFCHPGMPPPLLIALVEDRDLWRFDHEVTRPFGLWLYSEPFDFTRWDWIADEIERPYGNDILREATAMQRFYDGKIAEIGGYAHRRTIGDHEAVVVSCPPMFKSEMGHWLLDAYPDAPFAATFYDTGTARLWSLRGRGDGLPVSKIAEQFGGGGHRNAAGFKEVFSA